MESGMERRREARLQYSWPVWFAEDFDDILTQGQMVDVSSGGAAFTCYADKCPTRANGTGRSAACRCIIYAHGNHEILDNDVWV